jgi:hypothetical protein
VPKVSCGIAGPRVLILTHHGTRNEVTMQDSEVRFIPFKDAAPYPYCDVYVGFSMPQAFSPTVFDEEPHGLNPCGVLRRVMGVYSCQLPIGL